MAAPRLVGTKLFGGSFNGSLECLKWLRNAQDGSLWEPLMEPPRNLVPINLGAAMPEFTTCKRTIFMDSWKCP